LCGKTVEGPDSGLEGSEQVWAENGSREVKMGPGLKKRQVVGLKKMGSAMSQFHPNANVLLLPLFSNGIALIKYVVVNIYIDTVFIKISN